MAPVLLRLILQVWAALVLLPVKHTLCRKQGGWSHEKEYYSSSSSTSPPPLATEDRVTGLPGQPAVDFRHYAGYVTVHEKNGRALFYWFYEAESDADKKPLVLWLNGGPGCSSVGYGATEEIGPFLADGAGSGLKLNPYSWNKEANVVFLESPFGVGFSYTNTSSDYDHLGDSLTANDTYAFLHKWFEKFPSYRNRSFFIAGESYAGKYVPELAELIYDMNSNPALHIDLKGFLLGNPETSDGHDWQGMTDYAWSHAVVSDQTHATILKECHFFSSEPWSNACSAAVDEVLAQLHKIDIFSLYTPVCIKNSSTAARRSPPPTAARRRPSSVSSSNTKPWLMSGYDPCIDDTVTSFYNRIDVQKALHVNGGATPKNWTICNMEIFNKWADSKPSVLPIYKKLIAGGLRIWVYSGDTDARVSVLSTRYAMNGLGLPVVGPWKAWYHHQQVAGWVQEYEGLTFATFRGAGHAVPMFNPGASLVFFGSFLAGTPPPLEP